MAQPILPFALPLLVCDSYAPSGGTKYDFFGAFHAVRPYKYPHVLRQICVVAHLTGGQGVMTTQLDIRSEQDELIFTTLPRQLTIPNRQTLVRLVNFLEEVIFPHSGIYFIQLHCENTPIAEFRLTLHDRAGEQIGEANGKVE